MSKIRQVNFKKQQMAKALSTHLSVNLAMNNRESPLKKAYDNTYHCNQYKTYDGETMTGKYCKNRWCITCNRIRTAININHYSEQINKFGTPMFVTLTRPTCTIEELPGQLEHFAKTWRQIYKSANRNDRKAARLNVNLIGIRSIECTLRPNGMYHLHMHIILDGFNNAHWLVSEWLERNKDSSDAAQDARVANAGSLVELFKYAVKISKDIIYNTDYERLDSIFRIMKGRRLMSAFGGMKVIPQDKQEDFDIVSQGYEELQLRFGNEHSTWGWVDKAFDWINIETGEYLINEDLPRKIKNIVS